MASTAPLFKDNSVVVGGSCSTEPDYTTKEMKIGGMDAVPMADAGVSAVAPDLTPAELATGGAPAKVDNRKTYSVLKVKGGPMPSENAKYMGTAPSAALGKAARRVFKKSGAKEFTVLMRRVSIRPAERKLYQYDVKMVKAKKMEGFITIKVDTFTDTSGKSSKDVDKKVRIVQASSNSVWGYLQSGGRGVMGGVANGFPLVRAEGTNTLALVLPGAIPDNVQGTTVNKSEWDVVSTCSTDAISEADRTAFDTAAHVKMRETAALQHKKEQRTLKLQKARTKAAEEKAKAKAVKEKAAEAKARTKAATGRRSASRT